MSDHTENLFAIFDELGMKATSEVFRKELQSNIIINKISHINQKRSNSLINFTLT
jgi:hypothetical protein